MKFSYANNSMSSFYLPSPAGHCKNNFIYLTELTNVIVTISKTVYGCAKKFEYEHTNTIMIKCPKFSSNKQM